MSSSYDSKKNSIRRGQADLAEALTHHVRVIRSVLWLSLPFTSAPHLALTRVVSSNINTDNLHLFTEYYNSHIFDYGGYLCTHGPAKR